LIEGEAVQTTKIVIFLLLEPRFLKLLDEMGIRDIRKKGM
jgi:hypothetical protein